MLLLPEDYTEAGYKRPPLKNRQQEKHRKNKVK